ncbi:LysR family transcriptional regulator [Paenibacillus sp. y28]|uniref:LysR family transcriptional regulator n=1 Tax=Paenibacillus sp. y28 TaxID=3129110 RepID=UPI003016877A
MTLTQLTIFVKAVETGSFTQAGKALNMTQPAVSHAIAGLEAELGVSLMLRDRSRGIMLTDIGRRILIQAQAILKSLHHIEQEIAAEKGLETGSIHIGTFPSASAYFLPKIIRVFQESYPNLQIVPHEGTMEEINGWLANRVVDIGIIAFGESNVRTIPLMKEKMVTVLRSDHPLSGQPYLRVPDLEKQPIIMVKGCEAPIVDLFERTGISLRAEFTVHNTGTVLNMVQEGLGLAILPELALSSLPPDVQFREIQPTFWREISLAVPSRKETSTAVQLFIETIQQLFVPSHSRL